MVWKEAVAWKGAGVEVVLLLDQEEVLNQKKKRLNLVTCYQVLVFG